MSTADPHVFNKHHSDAPPGAIYIGRGSPWGNPFVITRTDRRGNVITPGDGNREEVIAKHKTWLLERPALVERVKRELHGKNLVCFCKPAACHGDTLLALANDVEEGS